MAKTFVRGRRLPQVRTGYAALLFQFPLPNGFVVATVLNYGFDSSHGEVMREPLPPAVEPGKTVELAFTKQSYDSFLHVLAQAKAPSDFETAPYYIERVAFKDQPDVIWRQGYLLRRNAVDFGKFDVFQKYFLPTKQN
jgi:hypothetical protein